MLPSQVGQGRDDGIMAYRAWVASQGGLPYHDAWDRKLPLHDDANAAAFAPGRADRAIPSGGGRTTVYACPYDPPGA